MSLQLSPQPFLQFFDNNGDPLTNGFLYTYIAGSSTPIATYKDKTGLSLNNPTIILDISGKACVWLDSSIAYKFVVKDSKGDLIKTTDNITVSESGAGLLNAAYKRSFTVNDLIVGQLNVSHNLNERSVQVEVYDNNWNIIVPTNIYLQSSNAIVVDLSSYTVTGTWNLSVIAAGGEIITSGGGETTRLNESVNGIYGTKSIQNGLKRSCGIIIPMYIYPTDPYGGDYATVIDYAKQFRDIPTMVAVNPENGPGAVVDGNYTQVINNMLGADITVIGYISTAYMATPLETVLADILQWKTLYPGIRGIWVDELVNWAGTYTIQEIINYYHSIYVYAKETCNLEFVFANPGATFDTALWYGGVADNITQYESAGYPDEATLAQLNPWPDSLSEVPVRAKSALVHTASSFDTSAVALLKKYMGYIYVTNDEMPNPWDTLSPYLEQLYNYLDASSGEFVKITGDTMTGTLDLATGTSAKAPLTFHTGDLLSTPVAGAIEFYNGKFYLSV